ncbi:hypothetical protein Btru_010714 [Bulinus truncatus]|nr:hypothetical protein Btru_010714 [Bulinus truncatus]
MAMFIPCLALTRSLIRSSVKCHMGSPGGMFLPGQTLGYKKKIGWITQRNTRSQKMSIFQVILLVCLACVVVGQEEQTQCDVDGVIYQVDENVKVNECTSCVCNSLGVLGDCFTKTCDPCQEGLIAQEVEGRCCPLCVVEEMK